MAAEIFFPWISFLILSQFVKVKHKKTLTGWINSSPVLWGKWLLVKILGLPGLLTEDILGSYKEFCAWACHRPLEACHGPGGTGHRCCGHEFLVEPVCTLLNKAPSTESLWMTTVGHLGQVRSTCGYRIMTLGQWACHNSQASSMTIRLEVEQVTGVVGIK